MRRRRAEGAGHCEVCGRVVLPGEPVQPFEDPRRGHRRRVVCPLCHRGAVARGWVRPGERDVTGQGAPAA